MKPDRGVLQAGAMVEVSIKLHKEVLCGLWVVGYFGGQFG